MTSQNVVQGHINDWMIAESIILGIESFGSDDPRDIAEVANARRVIEQAQRDLRLLGYNWTRVGKARPVVFQAQEVAA